MFNCLFVELSELKKSTQVISLEGLGIMRKENADWRFTLSGTQNRWHES